MDLNSYELAMILHECEKAGAGAFDFVELYPAKDPSEYIWTCCCMDEHIFFRNWLN